MDERPERGAEQVHQQLSWDESVPKRISALIDRESANERGHGPPMGAEDKAGLAAWRQFPADKDVHYRDLAERESLAQYGKGPELTVEEGAVLAGKRQFPDDAMNRGLATRELLASAGKLPPLSESETEHLAHARMQKQLNARGDDQSFDSQKF